MPQVSKEFVEEADEKTGELTKKEYLSIDETYRDYEPSLEQVEPLDPQIATEKEEPPVKVKDDKPTVEKLKKEIDVSDTPTPKYKDKVTPDEVVFDKSGAVKHDGKKPRLDLIPPEVITAMGYMFGHGARKYDDRNWEKGMDWGRVFGALQRHLWCWWNEDDTDKESGKSHLWHAACCLAMLIAYEVRGIGRDTRSISDKGRIPDK